MDSRPAIPSRSGRYFKAGILIALILAVLVGALAIPFAYESPSLLYKFGADKLLLRAGKLLGLVAIVLLFVQPLLATRLKLLDRIFGLPRVYALHRINGLLITVLVILHPVFILWPENFTLPPLKLEYWPEGAGALLVILIGFQAVVSLGRAKWNLAYGRWRRLHGTTGGVILLLTILHVLFVSETFAGGLPRYALLGAAGVFILIYTLAGPGGRWASNNTCTVTAVRQENEQITTLVLAPPQGTPSYLPGQFAFIEVQSDRVGPERHPFTLSSSPTRPENLMVSIKAAGDWTAGIGHLQTGDAVALEGPYGLFTHLICPPGQALVLIAGGIGITPMISMLRYLRDTGDNRPVHLLWSNRTRPDLIFQAELEGLARELTAFTMVPIFTREPPGEYMTGRLDRPTLQQQLGGADRSAAVFICGPPRMMAAAARDMRALGFSRGAIYTERFGY